MIIKTKALVIREYIVGESDKYITLLTKDLGKIQAIASKAKKHDRGLASSTQLFVYGEFMLSKHQDTYRLMNVEMINMFHEIRNDLSTLSYASYILELVTEIAQAELDNESLLALTLAALQSLVRQKHELKLIRRIFELRSLSLLGFMPELEQCVECSTSIEENQTAVYRFVSEAGGLVCGMCSHCYQNILHIHYNTLYTMKYIIHTPLQQLFSFNVHKTILDELGEVCNFYIQYHIDKPFKTLDFIKKIDVL